MLNHEQQISKNIIDILTPKRINHGQLHTFQIAINQQDLVNIDLTKRELIAKTLGKFKTNIFPIIVRDTDQYEDDQEYEVVYGADWCMIAKELEIEKLWVWIVELTDQQVISFRSEIEQLSNINPVINPIEIRGENHQNLPVDLILREIKTLQNQVNNLGDRIDNFEAKSSYVANNLAVLVQEEIAKQLPKTEQNLPQPTIIQSDNQGKNYHKMTVRDLRKIAKERKINSYSTMKKDALIKAIIAKE
jgi:hypothetical protein